MYDIKEFEPLTECPLCGEYIFTWWLIDEDELHNVPGVNCTVDYDSVDTPDALEKKDNNDYFVIDHNGPRI